MVSVRRGPLHRIEDAADLLLDEVAKAFAMARARADRVDDALGGGEADVSRNQQLFERLDGVDINRPATLLLAVGLLDDLLEAADDLLLGAREAVAKLVEKSQYWLLVAGS